MEHNFDVTQADSLNTVLLSSDTLQQANSLPCMTSILPVFYNSHIWKKSCKQNDPARLPHFLF